MPGSLCSANQRLICSWACGDLTKLSHSRRGPGGAALGVELVVALGLGDDLDHVAVGQRRGQRRQPAVDRRGRCSGRPIVGAELVRQVDRRGARPAAATGRPVGEDLDLRLGQVAAQRREELRRVGGVLLPVEHPLQPVELLGAGRPGRTRRRLAGSGSWRRCRTRRCGASPRCGSAPRPSGRPGRSRWCAASGRGCSSARR